jgi:hypothetical protein
MMGFVRAWRGVMARCLGIRMVVSMRVQCRVGPCSLIAPQELSAFFWEEGGGLRRPKDITSEIAGTNDRSGCHGKC